MEHHQNIKIDVDLIQLATILEAFYTVSHIKSTLYDTEFREILTYPNDHCKFCHIVRDQHIDRCECSDMQAFKKCRQKGNTIGYCCHIGLYEVVSPLRDGEEIVGYIMFGQMIQKEQKEKTIQKILTQYKGLEERSVVAKALGELESKTSSEIRAATMLMQTCICYLLSNRIVRINRGNFMEELNAYIESHLSQEIMVKDLCQYFGMSRSSFYMLADQCLKEGVMKYIRRMRIEKAKDLLKTTSKHITDISSLVGFLDYNYFLRIFKKETGMSCKAYRETTLS